MSDGDSWLVMVLEPHRLALAKVAAEPREELTVGGTRYRSLYTGAVAAFYDRILDDAGRLAGVRFWPTAEAPTLWLAKLPRRPYLRVRPDENYFDVYFRRPTYPDASSEGDQAFGGRIYEAAPGQIAISLDLDYLATSTEDLRAVDEALVDWVHVR